MMSTGLMALAILAGPASKTTPPAIALAYQVQGDVWAGMEPQPAQRLRLFDRLGRAARLRLAASASVTLAFVDGRRSKLSGPCLARLEGPGRLSGTCATTALPRVPALPPLALAPAEQPGLRSAAVRVRGDVIDDLRPRAPQRARSDDTQLEFAAVSGAVRYRVELRSDGGQLLLEQITTDTRVALPAGTLMPGKTYLWSAETVGDARVQARGVARFSTLDGREQRALDRLRATLAIRADSDDRDLLTAVEVALGLRSTPAPGRVAPCALLAPGLDVQRVEADSAAANAGLRSGDRLLSWCRRAPDDAACAAAGDFDTPLAWLHAEVAQLPRGGLRVTGLRDGETAHWELLPALQGMTLRPRCVGALAEICTSAFAAEERGQASDAAREFSRAADHASATPACAPLAAWLHAESGRLETKLGQHDAAERAFDNALAQVAVAGDEDAQASIWRVRSDARLQRGDFDGARLAAEQGLALAQQIDRDGLASARLLNRLGDVELRRDRSAEAERLFQMAHDIAIHLAPGSGSEAAYANNLALALLDRGDLDGAQRLIERAVAIRERLTPGGAAIVPVLSTHGTLLFTRGDLAGAEDAYRRALERLLPARAESLEAAKVLHNLGRISYARGDDEGAEAYLRRAARLQALTGDVELQRDTELALADVLRQRGQLAAAEDLYLSALERGTRLSTTGSKSALTLAGLAETRVARGRLDLAEAGLRQALAAQVALGPDSLAEGSIRTSLGHLLYSGGREREALVELQRAIEILNALEAPGVLDAYHALALVHERQGRRQAAAATYARALEALEARSGNLGGAEESRWRLRSTLGNLPFAAARNALALGDPSGAWAIVERAHGLGLRRLLAARDLRLAHEVSVGDYRERRRLAGLFDATQERLAALGPDQDAARDAMRAELRRLRSAQAQLDAAWLKAASRTVPDTVPTLATACDLLKGDTVALQYAVGERESLLFVLSAAGGACPARLDVRRVPLGHAALAREVDAFMALVTRHDSDVAALRRRAARLGRLLVGPLPGHPRRLLISADGPLHVLSFAALVVDGRYLAERHSLHFTPGLEVYRQLRRAPAHASRPQGVLVVVPSEAADAPGSTREAHLGAALRERGPLAALPFARREAEGLSALFPDARLLLGAEASEAEVKRQAPSARLLHFATHGLLDERQPLDSGLVLALPQHWQVGEENGLLQAWEVFEDLRLDADLVTLSACQTARGRADAGEGVLGLTRAFLFAGARAVLSSLWAVADASTAQLMRHHYAYLRAGYPKDVALQHAQLELLRSGDTALGHPYHWAGFELFGDAR
jgi:tetratricopeptide (TPR) repeat protein